MIRKKLISRENSSLEPNFFRESKAWRSLVNEIFDRFEGIYLSFHFEEFYSFLLFFYYIIGLLT